MQSYFSSSMGTVLVNPTWGGSAPRHRFKISNTYEVKNQFNGQF